MTGAELLIAGTAISAYGAYASSQAQSKALRDQASLRQEQATQAYLAGEREARIIESKGKRFQGAQVALLGQSGVQVSGSNLMLLEDTAANYKENALATREAARYRAQTSNTEAEFDLRAANEAEKAGYLNIASSLIKGISGNPYTFDSTRMPASQSSNISSNNYNASRTMAGMNYLGEDFYGNYARNL